MPGTVAEVLHRYGARVAEPELARALEELLAEHFEPLRGGAALSSRERTLLAHGGLRFDRPYDLDAAAAETTTAASRLLARAVRVADVAAALGVDASRVRHRIAAGELYAVPSGHGRARLIPDWQLDGDRRPLPGLPTVLAALPDDLHPLEVEGFFTTRQPDLVLNGQAASPRQWLLTAGGPDRVAALARDLHPLLA